MRILVLGGTSFVGRAVVEQALADGHELTLFSRGQTGTELFPEAERRTGDRDSGDYGSLEDGTWDAVIDVSGYVPRHVRQAADALHGRAGHCLFISSVAIYDHTRAREPLDESGPRLVPERDTEEITGETYGPLKVACEDDVRARWGAGTMIVRPGVVAGPHDPTDRFTYWVRRAADGGRVALPARPDQPVQVVDSRDLARLVVALVAGDVAGTFNAVGPAEPTTLEGLVRTCAAAAGSEVEVVPMDPAAVSPELPLVLLDESEDVIFRCSADAARAAGLTATPLEQTARDVLAWDAQRGRPELSEGLSAEQEASLLG